MGQRAPAETARCLNLRRSAEPEKSTTHTKGVGAPLTIIAQVETDFVVNVTEGRAKGVKLKPGHGLNCPAIDLKLNFPTEKDRCDLYFVVGHADALVFSVVQNGNQIVELQKAPSARRLDRQRLGLVTKIQTPAAVMYLPEVIVLVSGHQSVTVMIARGDLAVEMGFECVAEMREEIPRLCEAAQEHHEAVGFAS